MPMVSSYGRSSDNVTSLRSRRLMARTMLSKKVIIFTFQFKTDFAKNVGRKVYFLQKTMRGPFVP